MSPSRLTGPIWELNIKNQARCQWRVCLFIGLTVHTYFACGGAWPSTGETKWSTTFPTERQNPKQLRTRVWTPLPYTSLAVSMDKTHERLEKNWSEQHVSGGHVLSKLVWLKAHSTDYHLKCTGTKQSTHALLLISTEYDPAVFNSLGRWPGKRAFRTGHLALNLINSPFRHNWPWKTRAARTRLFYSSKANFDQSGTT